MAKKFWGRCFNYISPMSLTMTENPINSLIEKTASECAKQTDDMIYRAVLDVGVNVDKEELEKALRYDRGQYEKGYTDGLKNADIVHAYWDRDSVTGITVCSNCRTSPPGDAELEEFYESDYCPKCGALMDGE